MLNLSRDRSGAARLRPPGRLGENPRNTTKRWLPVHAVVQATLVLGPAWSYQTIIPGPVCTASFVLTKSPLLFRARSSEQRAELGTIAVNPLPTRFNDLEIRRPKGVEFFFASLVVDHEKNSVWPSPHFTERGIVLEYGGAIRKKRAVPQIVGAAVQH